MKKVISIWSKEEVIIDETSKKLLGYDNSKKRALYSARIIENGKPTMFYTDYEENGIVITDVEERLSAHNSVVKFQYGIMVACDWKKNDPNRELWNKIVEYAKSHEDEFFLKNGNLKKRFTVESIKKICGIR